MKHPNSSTLQRSIVSVCVLCTYSAASADLTCGTQIVFDLSPFQPFSATGELIGVTSTQGEVVHARIDAFFVSNEVGPWSMAVAFELSSKVFGLSDVDQGWAGAGKFSASVESSALNGFMIIPEGQPFLFWFLHWQGGVLADLPGGGVVLSPMDGSFEQLTLTLTLADCPVGDLTGDYQVGVADLLALLAEWGACPTGEPCAADFNGDGSVGVPDLLLLLGNWGNHWCPPPLC